MLSAPAIDTGQIALRSVMRALVGPVQTADEYKAGLMTLLEAVAIQRGEAVPYPRREVSRADPAESTAVETATS